MCTSVQTLTSGARTTRRPGGRTRRFAWGAAPMRGQWRGRRATDLAKRGASTAPRSLAGVQVLPARFRAPVAAAVITTTRTRRHRLRMVDGEVAAAKRLLVQLGNRRVRLGRAAHLHEGETAGLARRAITYHVYRRHLVGFLKQRLKVGFGGFVREIPNVQLRAHILRSCIRSRMGKAEGRPERNCSASRTQERREGRTRF